MELTDLQKKILRTFSLYCQSLNGTKVSFRVNIQNCSIEYFPDSFYDEIQGSLIHGYDRINNILEELSKIFEEQLYDYIDSCDNYAQLIFTIDCIEKDLTIEVYENVQTSTDEGSSDEIPKNEHFRGLVEYMKKNGYTIGHIYFNGGGDSGYIEDNIDFSGERGGRAPLDRFGEVGDYLYDMLNYTLSGWELDAGSSGSFEINLNDDMIYLGMNVYEYEMQLVGTLLRTEF